MISDVNELCDNHLIYIRDIGYVVVVLNNYLYIHQVVNIDYDKIKDDFIPFIDFMSNDYEIKVDFIIDEPPRLKNLFRGKRNIRKNIDVYKIINDKVIIDYDLKRIKAKFSQRIPEHISKFIDEFLKKK